MTHANRGKSKSRGSLFAMVDRTTRFARAVANFKAPSSAAFALSDWTTAFYAGPTTDEDQRLLIAASWIGVEAAAAQTLLDPERALLSPKWSTILAVAALNREYRTAVELAQKRAKASIKSGTVALDAIAALRIQGAGGQEPTVAEIAESATDLTENWLFDSATSIGTSGEEISDLAPLAVQMMKYYSFKKALNSLWNQAWHKGWYVRPDGPDRNRWVPSDVDREKLEFTWGVRQEANMMNNPNIDRTIWPKLGAAQRRALARKFSVVEVRKNEGRMKFKIGAISYLSKHMPRYMYEKGMLEGSYIADFVKSPMPIDQRLSVALLLEAWHVLLDIAHLLVLHAPLPTSLSPNQAQELALTVSRNEVVDAVGGALRVRSELANTIVSFLTFSFQTGGKQKARGNKGLWAAPLVSVPNSNQLLIPLAVLETSNLARRAEAWLEKGGITDENSTDSRGDRYEALYRSQIENALVQNKTFSTARCATNGIAKTPLFNEQVDLVAAFGNLCLIGEVKFLLMPADPHERERFERKLKDAATQAKRKAGALHSRRDVIASNLGISLADAVKLKLLPIVVTNQGYGFSTRVDDVLVLEANFLRTYLGTGKIYTAMAFEPVNGRNIKYTTTLYETETEAAENFEKEMSAPYVIRRFFDRVEWGASRFPTLVHDTTFVEVPLLQDVKGFERNWWELSAKELGQQ